MSRKRRIENSIFNLRKHIFKREIGCRTTRFTFQSDINLHKLENFSLSKHRDVKVVGHGAITSVAIDPLEWRYILAGNFVFSFGSIQKYTYRKVWMGNQISFLRIFGDFLKETESSVWFYFVRRVSTLTNLLVRTLFLHCSLEKGKTYQLFSPELWLWFSAPCWCDVCWVLYEVK